MTRTEASRQRYIKTEGYLRKHGGGTPSNLPLYGEALQPSRDTNNVNNSEVLPIEGEMPHRGEGVYEVL